MQAPFEEQMEAVNRIFRYLKTTSGKGLIFDGQEDRHESLRPLLILTEQSPLLTGNPPSPLLTGNPPLVIVPLFGAIS